ncbi:MAG: hypothetical protein ACI9EF_002273 [Pseudohongiellaceae bacterium]|jgi:hypothetical protein
MPPMVHSRYDLLAAPAAPSSAITDLPSAPSPGVLHVWCLGGVHSVAIVLALLVALLSSTTAAQGDSKPLNLPRTLSSSAQVSLITVMPGDQAWNLFGHGALRIADPVYRFDATFNYGIFNFDDGFIGRFIYGELDYNLGVYPFQYLLEDAQAERRTVIEQLLDLDGPQRQALYEGLMVNALPENRTYRYDFLFDNCSTRLVGILRKALGESLVLPKGPEETRTFRQLLATQLGAHLWFELGIETSLGSEVDETATFEQAWFLPALFRDAADRGVIDGRAFVSSTSTLYDGGREPVSARSQWPAAVAGALIALVGLWTARRSARAGQPLSTRTEGTLLFLCGVAGLVLLGFWFGTLHHVTANNGNVLWAVPTHVFLAFLLGRTASTPWIRGYLVVAGALMLLAFLGGLASWLQPMPTLLQVLMPWLGCRLLWRGLHRDLQAAPESGPPESA